MQLCKARKLVKRKMMNSTDSESDNPEDWIQIATIESSSEELKKQITKQQAIVSRWKRRRISKIVARC